MSLATDGGQTPSQTVGPFFHDALMRDGVDDLDPRHEAGPAIEIVGRVVDGAGEPVADAMVEVWQADGAGRYRHPVDGRQADVPGAFIGFGRLATGPDGRFHVRTVRPGTVPGRDGTVQAPHLNVHVFARGILDQLWTRIYLGDDPANDTDPVLASVPAERRHTLIADPEPAEHANADPEPAEHANADPDPAGSERPTRYRFDIHLQGAQETVFFAT
jgi:protocatechuate 3,4-dioxygenase, alpha subunit